jgi:hypothetical protein
MFDDCTGDWREISSAFWDFFYILVAGIYVTKTVKKCLQFIYIFADLLPVKCQAKFLILLIRSQSDRNQFFKKLSAQCLYNSREKYAFIAEQLFDKNSNFPQAFWSILPVQ